MMHRKSSERFEDSLAASQAFASGDLSDSVRSPTRRNSVQLFLEDLEPVLPDRPPEQIKRRKYDRRPSSPLSLTSINENSKDDDDVDRRPSILTLNERKTGLIDFTSRQGIVVSFEDDASSKLEGSSSPKSKDASVPICNISPKKNRSSVSALTKTQGSFLAMRRLREFNDTDTLSTLTMSKSRLLTNNQNSSSNSNNTANAVQRRARVLVVDDSKVNRTLLSKYVKRLGHETVTASNGKEALDILMKSLDDVSIENNIFIDIDLVLLDIYMPKLNGDEVLKIMMETEGLQQIPVIMISGSEEIEDVVNCIDMGAVDFLPKPFDPVLFKARMKSCLAAKHFRDRESKYLQQIEKEKKRSDQLLKIIYPEKVAQELKQTDSVQPRRYENVAVMFLDICGFTSYCNGQAPEDIIDFLQKIFNSLEDIADSHKIEKIKTIGDCFMATAGLLENNDNPVRSCVSAGLAMAKAVRSFGRLSCDVRVGIHVGPVIAGVVGRKRSLFDLWGDTVNTASRVESNGVEGGVTVSADAYACIQNECEAISLGEVEAKGKGKMALYQILRLT